jgi:hypothetical protein
MVLVGQEGGRMMVIAVVNVVVDVVVLSNSAKVSGTQNHKSSN